MAEGSEHIGQRGKEVGRTGFRRWMLAGSREAEDGSGTGRPSATRGWTSWNRSSWAGLPLVMASDCSREIGGNGSEGSEREREIVREGERWQAVSDCTRLRMSLRV